MYGPRPPYLPKLLVRLQIDGRGSDAAVLQGDLSACGADSTPSYVHVVDTVLLPFLPSMTGGCLHDGAAVASAIHAVQFMIAVMHALSLMKPSRILDGMDARLLTCLE